MSAIPATSDVVIIGAGVIGCSTAYHLTLAGIRRVVVVEMDQIGSGSSSKSASILTTQLATDESTAHMAVYCFRRYMQLEEELGLPIDFKPCGRLALATSASVRDLVGKSQRLVELGISSELVSPQAIHDCYPQINVDDIVCGAWSTETGTFDPHMIMSAFSTRAREKGARFCEGVRATGLEVHGGRVRAVVTTHGAIQTGTTVNAAGPWAVQVGSWAGLEIPILNRARTVVVTGPFPQLPDDWPFVQDADAQWYCRREGPGVLMGMGVVETDDLSAPFQAEMVGPIIDVAVHRIPVLEGASMLTGWTGLRPLTPDDRPILGPAPSVDGFYLNCGWGGEGIIMAPIAGQLLAECIADGRGTTLDAQQLSLQRFTDHRSAQVDQPADSPDL